MPGQNNALPLAPEPPTTLRFVPRPVDCDIAHTWLGGKCVTTIMRDWKPGESARCRLCPLGECTARGRDHCLVVVQAYVPPASAPMYSRAGASGLRVHAEDARGGAGVGR